jgi:hypothetical protein
VHQELVLARAGQRFVLDPPGRPSSASCVVVESSQGVVQKATAGACVIDPVDTTLTEAAPIAAKSLALASTANMAVGTRYQLTGVDGTREWFVVMSVTDAGVTLRRPLVNTFAPGSSVLGCRISIAVDVRWIALVANVTDHLDVNAGYRVHWSYVIDGVDTSTITTADVVRAPPPQRVSAADVDGHFPGWIANLPVAYRETEGDELLAEALDLVNRDVVAHREIRRARDAGALRELAIMRAKVVELEHAVLFEHGSPAVLADAEQCYRQRFDELLQEARRREADRPWRR